jgi:hypothetical protein
MSEDDSHSAYSAVADEQLGTLEAGGERDLYNATLDACDLVVRATGLARSRSTAIQTAEGVRFRLPIAGHPPYKVFWSHTDGGPRIEAVFPHPEAARRRSRAGLQRD